MMDIFNLLRKMDILLIDDDEWIRDSLSIYFDSEGCRIVTCETAEEGLQVLDRQRFDIIIADYRLPGMDGIQFFEQSRVSHPDIVKILITAYPTDTVSGQAVQAGVQRVVPKPFTSGDLLECLSALTDPAVISCQEKPLSGKP
jgi:CheY-like chemotaxis protein